MLCMGSGSATGFFYQVRLVHSLLKYFFKFQFTVVILNSNLHYQIFKFVIDNSDNCLQHIQKRRNFDAKVTCHQPICLLLHAILKWSRSVSRQIHNCRRQRRPSRYLFAPDIRDCAARPATGFTLAVIR